MKKKVNIDKIKASPKWNHVMEIISRLGPKTYIVGGAVRDLVTGKDISDIDFATNVEPELVEKAFERTLDIGKKFGTIVVLFESGKYEITTFREDFDYKDGRHPVGVKFGSLEDDVLRRDFTCNALYLDVKNETLIDLVGGLESIKKKEIKAVGSAAIRFKEDKLRMLRAIRFLSELNWKIEELTYDAIKSLSSEITVIKRERWDRELRKILLSEFPLVGLRALTETKILEHYLNSHESDIFENRIKELVDFKGSFEARFASFFYLSPPEIYYKFCLSKKSLNRINSIIKNILSLDPNQPIAKELCSDQDLIDVLKNIGRL